MVLRIARFINMWFSGILAGIGVSVWVTETANLGLDGSSYTRVEKPKHAMLTPVTLSLVIPTLLTGLYIAWALRRESRSASRLTMLGFITEATSFGISLKVNLPINRAQQREWSIENPPANWMEVRDRWNAAHKVRTVFAVASLAAQVLAWLTLESARKRNGAVG